MYEIFRDEIHLEPCPLCDCDPRMSEIIPSRNPGLPHIYRVVCFGCGLRLDGLDGPNEIATRWNRRPILTVSNRRLLLERRSKAAVASQDPNQPVVAPPATYCPDEPTSKPPAPLPEPSTIEPPSDQRPRCKPMRINSSGYYYETSPANATHLWLCTPGPIHTRLIPVRPQGSAPPDPADGPSWEWNLSITSPTLTPSILTNAIGDDKKPITCHSYIRKGRIEFLKDSTHPLAGQTLDLLDPDS